MVATFVSSDSRTEAAIVDNLASRDSALREGNRTIVAVSHSAKLINVADKVFRLSNGKLTELDRSVGYSLVSADGFAAKTIRAQNVSDPPRKAVHPATKPASPEEKQDMSRQTGDWSVYKYYFRTTSRLSLPLFAACSIGAAFCSSFTRESYSFLKCRLKECSINVMAEVWLQRWTESNTSNLTLYLTVFAALACFSILFTSANMV